MTERSLSGGQARTDIIRLPVLAAALLALAACGPTAATDAPAEKPKLHLLTSLPLLWVSFAGTASRWLGRWV